MEHKNKNKEVWEKFYNEVNHRRGELRNIEYPELKNEIREIMEKH